MRHALQAGERSAAGQPGPVLASVQLCHLSGEGGSAIAFPCGKRVAGGRVFSKRELCLAL